MNWHSALYVGSVSHKRLSPKPHGFRYSVFWTLIDIDELPAVTSQLRFLSHNRFNLFSFHDRDYGDGSSTSLRSQIGKQLASADEETECGAIRLLTMPRILGYAFNPLSIYFCYRPDGSLSTIIYEVHNTFRQRHSYLIPVASASLPIRQHCDKAFYVSPFLDMAMRYDFRVMPPGETLSLCIEASETGKLILNANLTGVREELCDSALLRLFCAIPFVTLKVVAAIHWQALRLYLKGILLSARPSPPACPVTIVTEHPTVADHSKSLG